MIIKTSDTYIDSFLVSLHMCGDCVGSNGAVLTSGPTAGQRLFVVVNHQMEAKTLFTLIPLSTLRPIAAELEFILVRLGMSRNILQLLALIFTSRPRTVVDRLRGIVLLLDVCFAPMPFGKGLSTALVRTEPIVADVNLIDVISETSFQFESLVAVRVIASEGPVG